MNKWKKWSLHVLKSSVNLPLVVEPFDPRGVPTHNEKAPPSGTSHEHYSGSGIMEFSNQSVQQASLSLCLSLSRERTCGPSRDFPGPFTKHHRSMLSVDGR